MSDWSFTDGFPSIEIDVDYWKTLSYKERGQYLMRLIFEEKDLGNRLNMINYILTNTAKVGKIFIKNPEAKEYLDILENSANLISVSAALGNVFKQKQKFHNTKNNDIAKLMGLPNGDYVHEIKLELTQSMAEAFIDMTDFNRDKYKITIDNVNTDDPKQKTDNDDKSYNITKTIKMTGTLEKDNKWGIIIKTLSGVFDDDEDTTSTTTCRLFYPVTGMKLHPDELKNKIQKIMYKLYIEKVDTRRNYVKIKGTHLEICERVNIDVNITNIDVDRITKAMRKVLNEESRRGAVLVGEPGVGKTICVHKLTNNFPDRLVFWVSPDSINNVLGIRNVFKIFDMFPNSIIVFDDLDSGPFTRKDEVTGEFINLLDGTNNKNLKAFILATVNDPSKLHSTLINRPERLDDVIYVRNPIEITEVIDIIFSKAKLKGYYPKDQYDEIIKDDFDTDNLNGYIDFDKNNEDLKQISNDVIKAKFTQAQVAGLINDCHVYTENNILSIETLRIAVDTRLESINHSNLVARKGRLYQDNDNLSQEAYASLNRKQ